MKKCSFYLLTLMVFPFIVSAQVDCFALYMEEGEYAMGAAKYDLAIKSFSGALKCPQLNPKQKAEAIRKNNEAFAASRLLVENALTKEEKERKQKEIESMRANGYLKALRAEDLLSEEEPGRALDSAYAAMKLFEGQEKPVEQVREIFGQAVKANFSHIHEEGKPYNIKDAAFFMLSNKAYIISRNKEIKIIDMSNKEEAVVSSDVQDDYIMAVADYGPQVKFVSTDRSGNIGFSEEEGRFFRAWKEGHKGIVYFVKYSNDGKYLLTGAEDKTAKIWNAVTEELMYSLPHNGRVYDGLFSDNKILTRCSDGAAYLWGMDGRLIKKLNAQKGFLRNIAFSNDGKKIITVSSDNSVFIWDENGGKINSLSEVNKQVENAVFSIDGRYVLTNTFNGQPQLWSGDGGFIKNIAMKFSIKNILSENKNNTSVFAQFLKDGKNMLVHSINYFQVQDIDGKNNSSLFHDPEADIVNVRVSNSGDYILTANKKNKVKLWNREGEELMSVEDHKGMVEGLSFSDDSQYFLSYAADGTLVTCPLPHVVYDEMNKADRKK